MKNEEPVASQEEYNKYVIRYSDIPSIKLTSSIEAQTISAENITLSFANAEPNAILPSHHHSNEQMLIVLDGSLDLVIEGKLYRAQTGDVIILPSNVEHGAYFNDKGARVLDVFSPPRQDFITMQDEAKKKQKTNTEQ